MINRIAGPLIKPAWPYTLNQDSPQARGLIGWWPGGELLGGTLQDLSGGKYNLAARGSVTPFPGVDGGQQSAISLGSSSYVVASNANWFSFERTNAFSFAVWEKSATVTLAGLISKGNATTGIDLQCSSSTLYRLLLTNTNTTNQVSCTTTRVNDGQWHLVTVTYDGSSKVAGVNWYVNGRKQVTGLTADNLSATIIIGAAFEIGGLGGGAASTFPGLLEDVRVYNRVISRAEAWSMYDPATRWDLRYVPGRKIYSFGRVAPSTFKPYYVPQCPVLGSGVF